MIEEDMELLRVIAEIEDRDVLGGAGEKPMFMKAWRRVNKELKRRDKELRQYKQAAEAAEERQHGRRFDALS